jgi:hypothetical protein
MTQKRFLSILASGKMRTRVSARIAPGDGVRSMRKMPLKKPPLNGRNNHFIKHLDVGWGARIRTWEWRN